MANLCPKQAKDFDLDVVEPFNQVLDLVLHRYLDTVNTVQELENPP